MILRGEARSRAPRVLLVVVALAAAAAGCGGDRHDDPAPCADRSTSYVACGCGCCGGISHEIRCLGAAQTICDVAREDRAVASSPDCAAAGCAAGVEYRVCGP